LKVIAIDKTLNNIAKRLSVFDHYHDGGTDNDDNNPVGSGSRNWDMINAAIAEHDGDPWYIPQIFEAIFFCVKINYGDCDATITTTAKSTKPNYHFLEFETLNYFLHVLHYYV